MLSESTVAVFLSVLKILLFVMEVRFSRLKQQIFRNVFPQKWARQALIYEVNKLWFTGVSLIIYEILAIVSLIKSYPTFFFPARQNNIGFLYVGSVYSTVLRMYRVKCWWVSNKSDIAWKEVIVEKLWHPLCIYLGGVRKTIKILFGFMTGIRYRYLPNASHKSHHLSHLALELTIDISQCH